jgi:hypothetical protein
MLSLEVNKLRHNTAPPEASLSALRDQQGLQSTPDHGSNLRPRLCPNSIAPSRLTNSSPTRWRRGWSSACAHGTRTNRRSVSGELETYETCYAACDFAATRRAWRLAVAVRGCSGPPRIPAVGTSPPPVVLVPACRSADLHVEAEGGLRSLAIATTVVV